MHVSNVFHLVFVIGVWILIEIYLRRTTVTRFRATMRLLQVIPVLFCVDLFVGVFAIEAIYGPHQSASWIAKTIWIYPGLFIIAIWRMLRAWRAGRKT